MASHNPKKPTPRRRYGPRRTSTIGVRLTPAEVAALDAFIAAQKCKTLSRAGVVASLAVDELFRLKFLRP